MTALEKLIRTASNDAAPHYRELAKEAQRELVDHHFIIGFFASCIKSGEPWTHSCESALRKVFPKDSCTPANSVDK